ncbi:MAG: choice-of-anchor Q domain-containing protein, partial [Chloroflexota bacterium]
MSNLPSRFRPILPASLALLFFASIMTLLSLTPDLAQAAVNCSDSSWAVGDEADLNAAIACFNGKNTFGVHTISLTQNIDLTSSTTAIGNTSEDISFVLDGNGYILNGQQITGVRPLDIVTGTIATVQYLTVTGGSLIGTGPTDGGAGIRSFGQLTLETSTVVSNTSGSNGGGIAQYGDAGNLQVTESTVAYNSAAGNGGGIYHHSSNGTVSRSTLHHNSSGGNGGGLFTDKANSSVSVSNSTISGNSAPSGSGGGIYNNDANLTVNSATVYTNSASTTGGIFGFYTNPTGGDTGLKNSIFAGNAGGDCGGTVVNNGNNIVQDGSCNGLGDQNDPMLAPLADNGGPTLTHAPMVGSLAIDEGATGLAMDQRGQARPIGVADDIGAFEFLPNHPVMVTSNNGTITSNPAGIDCGSTCSTDFLQGTVVSLTVMADSGYVFSGWSGDDSSSDNPLVFTVSSEKVVTANYIDCSGGPNWTVGSEAELSSAIACFNGETSAGQYTISLTNDVLLSTSTPAIDNGTAGVELLIAGNGYAVDGQNISGVRVFEINADTDVEMTQIIVKNGYLFSGLGAGILLNADGRLTVKNSQIVSNTTSFSDFGAGISAGDNTTLEVIDSQLEGNNGRSGGLSSSGQVIIQNSAFVDNVGLYGGAIVAGTGGTMTVTNSTFSGNSANFGGAILTIGASANIDTSTFMTNTSAQGVLRVLSGSINMDNSILADSSANNCGTAVLTGSNNLIDDESCGASAGDIGDPTNVDPTLADNGGPTLTHALLAGSNAIDAAGDTGYDADQRGISRPLGGADDIGAFEYTPPMTLT